MDRSLGVDFLPRSDRDEWDAHWRAFAETARANPAQIYRRQRVRFGLALSGQGSGVRLIDIGSGIGCMLDEIGRHAPEAALLGLELSNSGIAIASRRLPNAVFLQRDLAERADIPSAYRGWGTHAVCSEVLEHVEDPVAFLREAAAYMAPGCRLVVTVPGGPRSAYDLHIGHRRHFTRDQLRQVLERAGFAVDRVEGAGFPMFNLYRLLVCWRGRRLIDDAQGLPSGVMRLAAGIFRLLFAFNLKASRWGWQVIATAWLPERPLAAAEEV